jgi:hypothetical protein
MPLGPSLKLPSAPGRLRARLRRAVGFAVASRINSLGTPRAIENACGRGWLYGSVRLRPRAATPRRVRLLRQPAASPRQVARIGSRHAAACMAVDRAHSLVVPFVTRDDRRRTIRGTQPITAQRAILEAVTHAARCPHATRRRRKRGTSVVDRRWAESPPPGTTHQSPLTAEYPPAPRLRRASEHDYECEYESILGAVTHATTPVLPVLSRIEGSPVEGRHQATTKRVNDRRAHRTTGADRQRTSLATHQSQSIIFLRQGFRRRLWGYAGQVGGQASTITSTRCLGSRGRVGVRDLRRCRTTFAKVPLCGRSPTHSSCRGPPSGRP